MALVSSPVYTQLPHTEARWASLLQTARARLQPPGLVARFLSWLTNKQELSERRRLERLAFPCRLSCHLDGAAVEVTGIDLTLQGMALDTRHRLRRGARIVVQPPAELAGARPLTGWVRYCRERPDGFHTGVVFDVNQSVNSWVAQALQQLGLESRHLEQKRRHVRARADLPGRARRWCGELMDVTCADLSRGGALLRCPSPWPAAERVHLKLGPLEGLEALKLNADVVGTRGLTPDGAWNVGVQFVAPEGPLDEYVRTLLSARFR